ncbi:hypothetical protein ABIE69_000203 [Rhodobacteraceae bacterium MBR-64]|jgi:hypothetical protein
MITKIESVPIGTKVLAEFLGEKIETFNSWRKVGLLENASQGHGRPAEYRLPGILSACLFSKLLRIGVKATDAAPVANHADCIGPFTRASDDAPRVEIFFRDGRAALSGDPLADPILGIPLTPIFSAVVDLLADQIAGQYGDEDAGRAALAEFWESVAQARQRDVRQ